MRSPRLIRFLVSYVLVGGIVAAGVMLVFPELLPSARPVVEIRESEDRRGLARSGPVSYADAVEQAAPAVVNIYTSKRVQQQRHPLQDDPFFRRFFGDQLSQPGREQIQRSLGSGVIIGDRGHILTNNHVIQGADEIQVMLRDGRSAAASVVGADPETDLAVLAVDLENLPAMTLSRAERARVGDVVLAIGNPFGVGQTVTQGIISATGRSQLGLSTFENFIQTDAAINPGNSGGALIDANGELLGINTAIFSRSGGSHGIGFAIPAELALGVLRSIIEHGRVVRGWVGIEVQPLTPELAESFGLDFTDGVIVAGILRGGPADKAGLTPGDVIRSIDGEPVRSPQDLLGLISERSPGQKINVQAARQDQSLTLEVEIAERPESSALER